MQDLLRPVVRAAPAPPTVSLSDLLIGIPCPLHDNPPANASASLRWRYQQGQVVGTVKLEWVGCNCSRAYQVTQ